MAALAFDAVYGRGGASRTVFRPTKPPGCDCGGLQARSVSLSLTPKALVPLGDGRYALVSLERDAAAAHSEPGAISIAYVRRTTTGWRLEKRWDELAWTGDDGEAADAVRVLTPDSAATVLFATHRSVHQGEATDTAWAFVLGAEAPKLLGHLLFGGELGADSGCDFATCGAYAYEGVIGPPRSPGSLFEVTYRGWREAPGRPGKAPFTLSASYAVVGGRLEADHRLPLPA